MLLIFFMFITSAQVLKMTFQVLNTAVNPLLEI